MTAAQRRYVAIEAMIGATISAALSVAFVLAIFGRSVRVPVTGGAGLLVDAVPQGFAIAFMATLVPTLLTRRRVTLGRVVALSSGLDDAPSHPVKRALGMALLGAAATVALTALLLVAGVRDLSLSTVLFGKTIWGFLLGGLVAAVMTRHALARR